MPKIGLFLFRILLEPIRNVPSPPNIYSLFIYWLFELQGLSLKTRIKDGYWNSVTQAGLSRFFQGIKELKTCARVNIFYESKVHCEVKTWLITISF